MVYQIGAIGFVVYDCCWTWANIFGDGGSLYQTSFALRVGLEYIPVLPSYFCNWPRCLVHNSASVPI